MRHLEHLKRPVAVLLMLAGLLAGSPAAWGAGDRLPKRLTQTVSVERLDQKLFDEAVLLYSNAVRRQHRLAPLKGDPRLARTAADHAGNMARLRTHAHQLPVKGQGRLVQRMDRNGVRYRAAAENIAMDKVYRLLGRPISTASRGCSFIYGDTSQPVPIHSYASLAEQVVARWLASPKHRASLLSRSYGRLGSGVGVDSAGAACGDFYLVQNFAD